MKLYVYEESGSKPTFYFRTKPMPNHESDTFLGTVDLPIETPKKTVVKEATETLPPYAEGKMIKGIKFYLPYEAKNIKCTYEVTEEDSLAGRENPQAYLEAVKEVVEMAEKMIMHRNLNNVHPIDFGRLQEALSKLEQVK